MKNKKLLFLPAFMLALSNLSGCSLLGVVTWKNYDGTVLEQDLDLWPGQMPKFDSKIKPSRDSDVQYDYTWDEKDGWDREVEPFSFSDGFEVTYTAKFTKTLRQYDVIWKNGNGNDLIREKVEYGKKPTIPKEIPTKDSTPEFSYTFKEWSPAAPYMVEGPQTYEPVFESTTNQYKITFMNGDGSVLSSLDVDYGTIPDQPSTLPTRASTQEYDYTFKKWSPEITKVTEDAIYYPVFEQTRFYKVVWEDAEGGVYRQDRVQKDQTPTPPAVGPSKTSDAQYDYAFDHWDPTPQAIKQDTTFKPVYSKTRFYKVVWEDAEGGVYQEDRVKEGELPTPPTIAPTKASDDQYDYEFASWSPTLAPTSADVVYKPLFKGNIRSYTITFVDYNDEVVSEQKLNYGELPQAPTMKRDPDTEVYTFLEWDHPIQAVKGDDTYKAKYESRPRIQFNLTYYIQDGATGNWVRQEPNIYQDWIYEHLDYDLPSMTNDYYDVDWTLSPNSSVKLTTVKNIYDDMSFYGKKVQEHKFQVEYDFNGGIIEDLSTYPTEVTYYDFIDMPNNTPSMDGHAFSKWVDEGNNTFSYFYHTTSDIKLTAEYQVEHYAISFNCTALETQLSPINATYNSNSYLGYLPVAEKTGYTFQYWEYEGEQLAGPYLYTNDIEVDPVFEINTYGLDFDLGGGHFDNLPDHYTIESYSDALPEPQKDGYSFLGWKVTINNYEYTILPGDSLKNGLEDKLFDVIDALDLELTAIYSEPHTVTVKYDYDGGVPLYNVTFIDGGQVVDTKEVAYGVSGVKFMPLPDKDGLQFAGWVDQFDNLVLNSFEIHSDITLYAKWNKIAKRPIDNPNDPYAVVYEYDTSIAINNDQSVTLHDLNGSYLQFTSLIEQTITVTSSANFEVLKTTSTNDTVENPIAYGVFHESTNNNSTSFSAVAGQSYTIKLLNVQSQTGQIQVSVSTDAQSIYPGFIISAKTPADPAPTSCKYGEEIPGLVDLVKDGYAFDGWFIGNKRYYPGDTLDVDASEVTLVAHWHQIVNNQPAPSNP